MKVLPMVALAMMGLAVLVPVTASQSMTSSAAPTTTDPPATDADEPRGAAAATGVFNPLWVLVIAVGFVVFVGAGFLTRRRG